MKIECSPEIGREDSVLSPEQFQRIGTVATSEFSGDEPIPTLGVETVDAVQKTPYANEILSALHEKGDIETSINSMRDLTRHLGQPFAEKGVKNRLSQSVQQLHELQLLRAKKIIVKAPNGSGREVFASLHKPGNFIRLRYETYSQLVRLSNSQNQPRL